MAGMLAAIVLALSGCGELEHVKTADLSVSDIGRSGEEKSLDELIGAWEDATGEMCEFSEVPYPKERTVDSVLCDESTSLLYLYPSASDLKSDLNESNDATNNLKAGLTDELVGPNWRIELRGHRRWQLPIPADEVYEKLERELGGILVQIGDWKL